MMNGFGLLTYDDGRSYRGHFQDDQKHGNGIYTWASGKVYNGGWIKGKQNGQALFTSKAGVKRKSVWKNGDFVKWVETNSAKPSEDFTTHTKSGSGRHYSNISMKAASLIKHSNTRDYLCFENQNI